MVRLVKLLSVSLAASLVVGAAYARSGADFLPLSLGDRRLYSVHWDRMVEGPGQPLARSFSRGVSHEQVVAAGTPASPRAFQIQVDTIEWPAPGTAEKRDRANRFLEPGRNGVFLYAERESAKDAAAADRFHAPVLIVPPSPILGRKWDAGTLHQAGVAVDLVGVVLQPEDVSVGGTRYPNCLHLRLKGAPKGRARIEGTLSKIIGGTIELEVWLAPSVGVVREITTTELEYVRDEETQRTSTVVTRRLERAAGGAPPPAAAR